MHRTLNFLFFVSSIFACCGCVQPDPAVVDNPPAQSVSSESFVLTVTLETNEYRGGEGEKHWHLTEWAVRNDSAEPITETVLLISLFDSDGEFLGHHSVSFQHVLPGETARRKRLLYLKSDNIADWKPRCELVQCPGGDVTESFQLATARPVEGA